MSHGVYIVDAIGMPDGLLCVRNALAQLGTRVSPRDLETVEVEGMLVNLASAYSHGLPVGIGRKISRRLAAIEAAQNLAGQAFPDVALMLAPSLERFADDDGSGYKFFQGAYAPRLGGQVLECEKALRADPRTRQAVVSMWQESDRDPRWRDRPCTTEFQFSMRRTDDMADESPGDGVPGYYQSGEERLRMFVYMRSNDAFKGFSYDVFQFSQIQCALAHVLDVLPGEYTHFAASMHAYVEDWPKLAALEPEAIDEEAPESSVRWVPPESGPPWGALDALHYPSLASVQRRFRALLDSIRGGVPFRPANPVERWYTDALGITS